MIRIAATVLSLVVGLGLLVHADPPAASPAEGLARLTVEVADLRSTKGKLIFSIFSQAKGFPNDPDRAVVWAELPASDAKRVFVADLPPGQYAASVLHDENANGDMDKNLLGIPKEGYGVTNNPKPKFRAAKYQEAQFNLPDGGATMRISIQYKFN